MTLDLFAVGIDPRKMSHFWELLNDVCCTKQLPGMSARKRRAKSRRASAAVGAAAGAGAGDTADGLFSSSPNRRISFAGTNLARLRSERSPSALGGFTPPPKRRQQHGSAGSPTSPGPSAVAISSGAPTVYVNSSSTVASAKIHTHVRVASALVGAASPAAAASSVAPAAAETAPDPTITNCSLANSMMD